MSTSIVSLIVANIFGIILMAIQIVDAEWSRNTKFFMISVAFIPAIIALYNISVLPHDDRRIMSFGLSALALAFLSSVGTLMLH